jgi:hypothetical protein
MDSMKKLKRNRRHTPANLQKTEKRKTVKETHAIGEMVWLWKKR